MKGRFISQCLIAAALGVLSFSIGCSTSSGSKAQPNGSQNRIAANVLFEQNCAKCHGKDGRAKTFRGWLAGAQNFTDLEWQATTTDEQMVDAILKGPKAMPSFADELSSSEISALVAYIRLFKPLQ